MMPTAHSGVNKTLGQYYLEARLPFVSASIIALFSELVQSVHHWFA
jgi:hypothetical protein